MVIGLLVVLGVDLVVIVIVAVIVFGRRRWVRRQPDVFSGAVRVSAGEVHGLRTKWSRGYGRWVGQTFVWTKAPLLFRTEVLAGDALVDSRAAGPGEIKRLGDHPVVAALQMGNVMLEVAAAQADVARLEGPFHDEGRTVRVAQA